ncbi:LysR family transcriptional regulator [Pseudaquabacterium pictum]|uniref:Transcriptional regulator n=1 Tax=Pseudaquabacterium pictum TaxID=2315236 RepID=A0A480AW57_9BURK|nr:LysR family transcriptional regulator [Rubrivivax pictus]GCL64025.1 transcriptional regulator [Rubrivivax pictus]
MTLSTDMLAAFVQVAEHLSVSAAAQALGVSKSVVSKRVAQLEQAVRATLFARSTRRVALTPAGEAYLDFARNALRAVADADERLRDLRQELSGQIRLTAPISWGQHVLAPLLPAFLAQHPAIEIELLLADRLMDIAYERIDLALRMSATGLPDLVATPVARLDWVVCAAPAHLARAGTPATPADLPAHPCMSYWRERSDNAWVLRHATTGDQQTVWVQGRYHANNPEAVAQAAVAGLGVALLPLYVCADDLAAGRLQRLLPDWTPVTKFGDQITAVAAPDRMRLLRNRALLDHLRQRLAPGV